MIKPIIGYGDPILKSVAKNIDSDYLALQELIESMFLTMENAQGVGLAAPQIGLSIRLFIVDTAPFSNDKELTKEEQLYLANFRKVFINPTIITEEGEPWSFKEGCLSIPDIREDVLRKETVELSYKDENFEPQTLKISGIVARVIQHEYDHLQGVLFTDKISSFKKKLIKRRLEKITKGKISPEYPMKFYS